MNKKMITLLVGASLVASAGIAAADGTIALYGSSAQAKYWAAQAATYMGAGGLGCSNIVSAASIATPATSPASYAGTTHYQVTGKNCTNAVATDVAGTGTLTFLYTANDSVTGIQSISGTGGDPDGCGSPTKRVMYPANGTANCQTVHMGVADVQASSITQKNTGHKFGPAGGPIVSPDFSAVAPSAAGMTVLNPKNVGTLATPFGFFANKTVTAKQCTAGLVGTYCADPSDVTNGGAGGQPTANKQCDSYSGAGDGVCGAAAPITNITRLQAVLLYSGQVYDWSNFGSAFSPVPVVVCARTAGSGTQATFDWAIMRAGGTGWGSSTVTSEQIGDDASIPTVYFNNASGDMMSCINGQNGAIGFADADTVVGTTTNPNVVRLAYNGVFPTRTAVRNGLYDFYASAWFYTNPGNGATVNALAKDMVTFAQIPTNMAPSKSNYWATVQEMNVWKTGDKTFPASVGGANYPMLP